MIRDICKDEAFLAQKAEPATPEDISVALDLLETLEHHQDGCVGMAANMIGMNKRIIAFEDEGGYMVMFNPEIIKKSGPYDTEEGCLSLTGIRPTKRWQNEKFQERLKTFAGRNGTVFACLGCCACRCVVDSFQLVFRGRLAAITGWERKSGNSAGR